MEDNKVYQAQSYFNYSRRYSSVVCVGDVPMGGGNPVRLQSMTTRSTLDTDGCVLQSERIIQAGGEYVRLTTQGRKEAENLLNIRNMLRQKGYATPLIADVHFNPAVADVAAGIVEGVRINPGNYVDSARTFKHLEYTDEEYKEEIRKIEQRLIPFLDICKAHHTAVRIGVNHGSLSDRIMSRYGDTPQGIVESCLEFLRICRKVDFNNVVISIKASDTAVMVQSVRLLVRKMEEEGMTYPLHLGVTEAGEGENGRIKSALGIGALLSDGIGDTIRVSLSEEPEKEIPVARKIVDHVACRKGSEQIKGVMAEGFDYIFPERRHTRPVANIGGNNVPVVISDKEGICQDTFLPDYIYNGERMPLTKDERCSYIVDIKGWQRSSGVYPAFAMDTIERIDDTDSPVKFLFLPCSRMDNRIMEILKAHPEVVVIAQGFGENPLGEFRALIHSFMNSGVMNPVAFFMEYSGTGKEVEDFQIESALDLGALLFDGFCDGLYLRCPSVSSDIVSRTSFALLQGAGIRRTSTEYISCPGCGRTLYDLQGTIARIKEVTQGLPSLKIAVMGCIVNGPGEMAGADYGYVGAARGKISLYRGKECVEKNIPESEAVDHLLQLLRKDSQL